jgi:hypothetical protein
MFLYISVSVRSRADPDVRLDYLRSDTVTRPTPAMRAAIAEAEVSAGATRRWVRDT